ncbi:hypothetical protein JLS56_04640 [Mycoplasma mycoides subsp. capri]|nr:hypothetical protein JLS56_04640 [Mycoplasma mycoides subsp. capri]
MLKLGNVGKEQQLEQVLEIENKLNTSSTKSWGIWKNFLFWWNQESNR